jgi:hypothetical protein
LKDALVKPDETISKKLDKKKSQPKAIPKESKRKKQK